MSTAKPQPVPTTSEADLPEGWAGATLGEIAELVSGAGFPLEFQGKQNLKYPFFKVGNLGEVGSSTHLTTAPDTVDDPVATTLRARIIPAGSIVFAKIGMAIRLNRRRLTGVPCCIDNNMMAAIPNGAAIPRYLQRYLETVDFMELTQATTVPSIRKTQLQELLVPVPPLAEQRRIVEKVEQLLARVNDARERLARVPAILKRFRQAVLAAACSGRLTEVWRTRHAEAEPAGSLLREIGPEVLASRTRIRANKLMHLEEHPFEVPTTWRWASVSDICQSITDGDHQPPPKSGKGVPFLVISNISSGKLDFTDTMFVLPSYHAAIAPDRKPRRGDILYSVTGSYGIPVLVDTDEQFCFQRHIALLRPHPKIPSLFLFRVMASDVVYRQASAVATGIAQLTVPLSGLRVLQVPVAPLEEQHEIVRRVEALFKLADTIEKRVAAATLRAGKLTQAILAKAFRGELVPTEAELARREDRSYEPASLLLERIRAERQERRFTGAVARRSVRLHQAR